MLDAQAFSDFDSAARTVLGFLHACIGFDLWMVTRTEGQDWIVLQARDHGYGVEEGDVFRWADSFCCQMVAGYGPRIAPRSDEIPAYAIAPIGRQVQIGAYIGVPLIDSSDSLFGTLCAIHPTPQVESITDELALVELLAKLLSTLLNVDLLAAEQTRGSVLDVGMRMRENQRTQTLDNTEITAMVLEPVKCPTCNSLDLVKYGKTAAGKQRYKCRNSECTRHSFVLEYSYRGYLPAVKQQICDMAMNGSGIRDTARVLKISPTTVIEALKKRSSA